MNVIAGMYRGKRLSAPEGSHVRPTGSKVREAIFDILGPAVEGIVFLDLYAGSGAVGIEALSRGAASCAFVEENPKALRYLRGNLEALNPPSKWRLLPFPAVKALKVLRDTGFRADILFADPPYACKEWPSILLSLPKYGVTTPSFIAVLEHASAVPPQAPQEWGDPRRYRYGDTSLAVYRVSGEGQGARSEE